MTLETMVSKEKVDTKTKLIRTMEKYNVGEKEMAILLDQIRNPESPLKVHKHMWAKDHVRIGLMGDTHFGSKYQNQSALEDIYKRFKAAGVTAVYHTGDITEGYARRPGHSFECSLHGADEQVDGVVKNYPKVKGITTYFITGDHDSWHYIAGGVNVGKAIAQKRPDMKHIGDCHAEIQLGKKTKMMLVHPSKGTSYALSYQVQKMVEALSGGEKPNILAVGHYHKIEYMFYRNVHCFQTGTLQNQTPWMKRMNLAAHVGGWILDVYMKKDGTIDKLQQTLVPYYQ